MQTVGSTELLILVSGGGCCCLAVTAILVLAGIMVMRNRTDEHGDAGHSG